MIGGAKASQAKSKPQYTGVSVQTSVLGAVIAVGWGKFKISPNLIWTGDFRAVAHKEKAAGGKGGGAAPGGQDTYTYEAAVAMGLLGVPIASIGTIWKSKSTTTLAAERMVLFPGLPGQTAWGYLLTNHPDQALAYKGLSYIASGPLDFGDSADISNFNFEVMTTVGNAIPGKPDADPKDVVMALLPNSDYGPNFPAARIGDLSTYSAYCRATGLVVSPKLDSQQQCSQTLSDLVTLTNSEVVWNGSVLTIVPYGDQAITANGATYTPPSAPLFDLTDDDFMPADGEDPVQLTIKRPCDAYNKISLEFVDRANAYNTDLAEAKGQAEIDLYGVVAEEGVQAHQFCDRGVAKMAAQLRLQRQYVYNNYQFKLGIQWLILDAMDIVTISNDRLGLDRQWVRIKEISEDSDNVLTITAEEYLAGTGAAPVYGVPAGDRYQQDFNAQPGPANTPVIFEPNLSLSDSGGLEVWAAVAGSDTTWGGCDVWASDDGITYKQVGTVHGNSRYGALTATLPTAASPDQINTLSVDLSISLGELTSGTTQDALQLNTICLVGSEYIAYAMATLTAPNEYDLTYLVRGAMDTEIGSHAIGEPFVRLDTSLVKIPVDQSRIGQTIYLKFVGFNATGGGFQDISEVPAYTYQITGGAMLGPLADPTQVTTNYVSGILQIRWTGVSDLRQPLDYEIRKGVSFGNSQLMGRTTDLYYPAAGDGTYWIAAHFQTDQGLDVYSGDPPSIVIENAALVKNVIAKWDEQETGWSGTVSGGAYIVNGTVMLGGTNDILSEANILADMDILFGGNVADSGVYTAPVGHTIELTQPAPCPVTMSWNIIGQSIYDNILTVTDVLSQQDILGSQFNPLVAGRPQVSLSQDGVSFGDWQNFSPGAYTFKAIRFQMVLASFRDDVTAIMDSWTYLVDVPDRIETGTITSDAGGVQTFFYKGSDLETPTPFNGGINGNTAPVPQITILGAEEGDTASITNMTLASFDHVITNGGVPVVRDFIYTSQGY